MVQAKMARVKFPLYAIRYIIMDDDTKSVLCNNPAYKGRRSPTMSCTLESFKSCNPRLYKTVQGALKGILAWKLNDSNIPEGVLDNIRYVQIKKERKNTFLVVVELVMYLGQPVTLTTR